MQYYILLTPNSESHTNTAEISMQGNKIIKKHGSSSFPYCQHAQIRPQNLSSFQFIPAYSLPNKTRRKIKKAFK